MSEVRKLRDTIDTKTFLVRAIEKKAHVEKRKLSPAELEGIASYESEIRRC